MHAPKLDVDDLLLLHGVFLQWSQPAAASCAWHGFRHRQQSISTSTSESKLRHMPSAYHAVHAHIVESMSCHVMLLLLLLRIARLLCVGSRLPAARIGTNATTSDAGTVATPCAAASASTTTRCTLPPLLLLTLVRQPPLVLQPLPAPPPAAPPRCCY